MLEPKDLIQVNMRVPIFSPDLKVWRTSLLEKVLVTGTIGVNPDLVERDYNFPRFRIMSPESETEKELMSRIRKSGQSLLNILSSENIFSTHELNYQESEVEANKKNSCCSPTRNEELSKKKH